MIEDETYYCVVIRSIHLNPVRAGLVDKPAAWQWSSYPGYVRRASRLPWKAYDRLLSAWRGEHGGSDASSYRHFVQAGFQADPPHGRSPASRGSSREPRTKSDSQHTDRQNKVLECKAGCLRRG